MGRINVTIRIFAGTLVPNITQGARSKQHRKVSNGALLHKSRNVANYNVHRHFQLASGDAQRCLETLPATQPFPLRDCTCTGSLL